MNIKNFMAVDITTLMCTPVEGGHYQLLRDRHWAVDEAGNCYFYIRGGACSPQCNREKSIAECSVKSLGAPLVGTTFLRMAWIPIKTMEFDYDRECLGHGT